jgi:hypothetical protein
MVGIFIFILYIIIIIIKRHAFTGSSYGLGYGGAYHNGDAWSQ